MTVSRVNELCSLKFMGSPRRLMLFSGALCHSHKSPKGASWESINALKTVDSRFHGNDSFRLGFNQSITFLALPIHAELMRILHNGSKRIFLAFTIPPCKFGVIIMCARRRIRTSPRRTGLLLCFRRFISSVRIRSVNRSPGMYRDKTKKSGRSSRMPGRGNRVKYSISLKRRP